MQLPEVLSDAFSLKFNCKDCQRTLQNIGSSYGLALSGHQLPQHSSPLLGISCFSTRRVNIQGLSAGVYLMDGMAAFWTPCSIVTQYSLMQSYCRLECSALALMHTIITNHKPVQKKCAYVTTGHNWWWRVNHGVMLFKTGGWSKMSDIVFWQ